MIKHDVCLIYGERTLFLNTEDHVELDFSDHKVSMIANFVQNHITKETRIPAKVKRRLKGKFNNIVDSVIADLETDYSLSPHDRLTSKPMASPEDVKDAVEFVVDKEMKLIEKE